MFRGKEFTHYLFYNCINKDLCNLKCFYFRSNIFDKVISGMVFVLLREVKFSFLDYNDLFFF